MIAIVGCGKAKGFAPAAARDLYIGNLFRASYAYARRHCSHIWILSAKFGLVRDSTWIWPYDETVSRFTRPERERWVANVALGLRELPPGKILALVSAPYEIALIPRAIDIINPLHGLPIGKRLQLLKGA